MTLKIIRRGIDRRIDDLETLAVDTYRGTTLYACLDFKLAFYRLLYTMFN